MSRRLWFCICSLWLGGANSGLASAQTALPPLRQPAYISNAYFTERLQEDAQGRLRSTPLHALSYRASGELGYLVLDLILVKPGRHQLRVELFTQQGDKAGTLGSEKGMTFLTPGFVLCVVTIHHPKQ
ncbi:hypothetical protein, partial [Candidatus Magnetaquicoccus inordinatus]|uniref:hypothetical protein n=1 Tax=Candidatus Magnetaquicoccus inordinatus TaxID=2496818 RepID=UPI00102D183B